MHLHCKGAQVPKVGRCEWRLSQKPKLVVYFCFWSLPQFRPYFLFLSPLLSSFSLLQKFSHKSSSWINKHSKQVKSIIHHITLSVNIIWNSHFPAEWKKSKISPTARLETKIRYHLEPWKLVPSKIAINFVSRSTQKGHNDSRRQVTRKRSLLWLEVIRNSASWMDGLMDWWLNSTSWLDGIHKKLNSF